MNIDTIVERIARELLEANPELATANQFDRGMMITHALHDSRGTGPDLISAFVDDESFGDLRNGWIQPIGSFGMITQPHMVPHIMVDGAIAGTSVKSLTADARAFAASPSSVVESYTALTGATVRHTIKLDDTIELVPWPDVPDGGQKEVFGTRDPSLEYMSSVPIPNSLRPVANMAVRVRSAECKILFSSSEDAQSNQGTQASHHAEQNARIRDVIRAITLQGESGVAELGSWVRIEKEFANDLVGIGYHFVGSAFDPALHFASRNPAALEAESITHLYRCLKAFNGSDSDWQSLRICIDRLNQSLRRPELVDKAIDLGIVLEALLLHSFGAVERGELRYRLSLRGAMFLGGCKTDRLNTFKLLRDAYDLRSKAVHAGSLTAKKNESPPTEMLENISSVCARLVRKLIERGSFPDWDTEYVIGEG